MSRRWEIPLWTADATRVTHPGPGKQGYGDCVGEVVAGGWDHGVETTGEGEDWGR